MAMAQQQMQQMLMSLQQSLMELTQEMQQMKVKVDASTDGLATLEATSEGAWGSLTKRLDEANAEITEAQSQIRRGGGGGGGHRDDDGPRWNLEHKGTLKEYGGDKKAYRPWAKKVMAFCNSKVDGFRKALIWAEKMQSPISEQDLQGTGWPHIMHANSKLKTCCPSSPRSTPSPRSRPRQVKLKDLKRGGASPGNACQRAGSRASTGSTTSLRSSRARTCERCWARSRTGSRHGRDMKPATTSPWMSTSSSEHSSRCCRRRRSRPSP